MHRDGNAARARRQRRVRHPWSGYLLRMPRSRLSLPCRERSSHRLAYRAECDGIDNIARIAKALQVEPWKLLRDD
jgi:hypothetical protein